MSESAIFKAAVKLAPERRPAYLDQTCGADPELRREVESLLRAHDASGSFLQDPPARPQATIDDLPITEGSGTVIGPYKLLQQIGEGGMGIVYMAEQQEPVRRKVALKIIKPGMDSRQVIARFEAERQALAMMDHQNIAKVLDAGTTDTGRPYFVMELVHGISLTKYCDDNKLTPRQRLELFVPICQAIQHAHQKGIIHRDVKPSNVLVTMYDDKPVPKVIDFGVAKAVEQRLTEKTLFTQYGTLVGTFEYMSPEQAEMNAFGVDTRSDIYSLGVLLYELLTGTTPLERQRLREAAFGDIVRRIKEEDPPKPSTRLSTSGAALATISQQRGSEPAKLTKQVRGELDWIVMRCLEKDRSRRYETANGLARDVERYLKDEPVEACPPTAGYKLRKFARKHSKVLATAATFAALLLLSVAASTWQAVRATQAEAMADANALQAQEKKQEANQQRDEAERQRDKIKALNDKLQATEARRRRALYVADINRAQHALEAGGTDRARELLEQHRPGQGEADLRNFEWHYLRRLSQAELLTLRGHTGMVFRVAYSPDGQRLATGSRDRTAKVWDARTGKELFTLQHAQTVNWVAFSPDGKHLATHSAGGTVMIWDARLGKEGRTLPNARGPLAFSPDGKTLASGSADKTIKLWDAASGKERATLKGTGPVAFSPDGKTLASGSTDNTVKLWDTANGQERATLKGHAGAISSVAFSADGKTLASGSADKTIKLWDAASGKERATLKGTGPVAFSPDGKTLASASRDGTVKVWEAQKGNELRTLKLHTGEARAQDPHRGAVPPPTFSPDGKRLASTDSDRTVMVWDAQTGEELSRIKGHSGAIYDLAFSPDGQRLASASADTTVKVWDARTDVRHLPLKGRGIRRSAAFSPDGKRVVIGENNVSGAVRGEPSEVKVWDAQTGKVLLTLKGHTGSISAVAFSPDGKLVAAAGRGTGGEVKVWDAQTGEVLLSIEGGGNGLAFSPDGKRLASTTQRLPRGPGAEGRVEGKVWDAKSGMELVKFSSVGPGGGVAFSPDGKRLVGLSRANHVTVWDAETGKELLSFSGWGVAFSPDGKHLAGSGSRNEVKVWDAQTGKALLPFKGHTDQVARVAFGPDGKRLASASADKTVKVWDVRTREELLTLKHTGTVDQVVFSPDGHHLAAVATDGTVKIWDATPVAEKP